MSVLIEDAAGSSAEGEHVQVRSVWIENHEYIVMLDQRTPRVDDRCRAYVRIDAGPPVRVFLPPGVTDLQRLWHRELLEIVAMALEVARSAGRPVPPRRAP